MRWPWSKSEKRESGGDFSDAVVRQIEAQAAGSAADASSTAAVEAASGALSRAFASAEVIGDDWVVEAVTPGVLGQIGRDLVRKGSTMHAIRLYGDQVVLIPVSSWHWEGSHDPASWTVRATAYGPSTSTTWNLPASGVVFCRWGSNPGQPYVGVAPTNWAHTTARLNANAEKSLADEAGGPVAMLLPVPQDPGDSDDDDNPLSGLRADIAAAKGKALLVETTAGGWGEGAVNAPRADWKTQRLAPSPTAALVALADASFTRVLAATGTPPTLFTDSDGTSQREGLRRWHLGTVLPLARLVEHELTAKLETRVRLKFDGYATDMVSRATVFSKLASVEGISPEMALAFAQIGDGDD